MGELFKPFYQIWTHPPQQWHPLLVHFPIVFLILEGILVVLFWLTRKTEYERWAFYSLHLAFWGLLIAAITGFHDSGLDMGRGNKIWLGLVDRWQNLCRWQSSVTVHSWLASCLLVITTVRLLWRVFGTSTVLRSMKGWGYVFLTFISLWLLMATVYIGGLLTHR